jgi:ACS family phthalate transporter-like MFS transporter
LTESEKAALASELAQERTESQTHGTKLISALPALFKTPRFLIVLGGYFCLIALLSTLTWTPQILRALNIPVAEVAFLAAVPSAIGVIATVLVARSSDLRNERRWHYLFVAICGGFGLCLLAAPDGDLSLKLAGLTLANAGGYGAMSIFWTIAATAMTPAQRPVGIAFVSLSGVCAGMLSPIATGYLRDATGGYEAAAAMGAAGAFMSALLITFGAGEAKPRDIKDGMISLQERP